MLSAIGVVAALLAPATARAQTTDPDPDPWFGPDKAAHFGVGAGLGGGGYALGAAALDSRWAGVGFGAGFGLVLSAIKEGLDAAGLGDPSYKDFLWGALGTTLGVGIAITFDAALRGPHEL